MLDWTNAETASHACQMRCDHAETTIVQPASDGGSGRVALYRVEKYRFGRMPGAWAQSTDRWAKQSLADLASFMPFCTILNSGGQHVERTRPSAEGFQQEL